MMRPTSLLLTILASASAETHTITPGGSDRIALEVYKTGLFSGKKHLFIFPRYRGTLEYDPARPGQARIELVIEAARAECKDTWVNPNELKKIQEFALQDMLAAAQFPEIVFRSAKVAPRAADVFDVEGTLVIRGIAKPSRITVTRRTAGDGAVFEGTAQVRHSDYGLKPSKAALGAIGTKDEMTVTFRLTAR